MLGFGFQKLFSQTPKRKRDKKKELKNDEKAVRKIQKRGKQLQTTDGDKGKVDTGKKGRPVKAAAQAKEVKHRKLITMCEHVDGDYYAGGMCKNCYHSKGR